MWALFLKPQHSCYNSYNHRSYVPGKWLWWRRGSPEEKEIGCVVTEVQTGQCREYRGGMIKGEKGKKRCVTEGK